MLPPQNGVTYRADFKYLLEQVKENGLLTGTFESDEAMGSGDDNEQTEREELEVSATLKKR
jgi:hypothetical protein